MLGLKHSSFLLWTCPLSNFLSPCQVIGEERVDICLSQGQRDLWEGRDLGEQLVSGNCHLKAAKGRRQGDLGVEKRGWRRIHRGSSTARGRHGVWLLGQQGPEKSWVDAGCGG